MNFEYYCVLLYEEAKNALLAHFNDEIPEDWNVLAHHMTILHRSRPNQSIQAWAEEHLGQTYTLEVTSLGLSSLAMAVKVSSVVPSANVIPHVTIAIPLQGKAVNSNKIIDWKSIQPFAIQGKIARF